MGILRIPGFYAQRQTKGVMQSTHLLRIDIKQQLSQESHETKRLQFCKICAIDNAEDTLRKRLFYGDQRQVFGHMHSLLTQM